MVWCAVSCVTETEQDPEAVSVVLSGIAKGKLEVFTQLVFEPVQTTYKSQHHVMSNQITKISYQKPKNPI